MKNTLPPPMKMLKCERGMAFVATISLLIVLTLLITVSTQWSAKDIRRSAEYTKSRESFYVAESGVQRALDFFNYDGAGFCPGAVDNGFDDEIDGTNWPAAEFQNIAYGDGVYNVTLSDNTDGDTTKDTDFTVVLTSTGTKRGVTTAIEALLYRPLYKIDEAFVTKEKLTAVGGFLIDGTNGTVHSDDVFDQNGKSGSTSKSTAVVDCQGVTCPPDWQAEEKHPPFLSQAQMNDLHNFADFILYGDRPAEGNYDVYNTKVKTIGILIGGVRKDVQEFTWNSGGGSKGPCLREVGNTTAITEANCTGTGPLAALTNTYHASLFEPLEVFQNGKYEGWKITSGTLPDGMYYVEGDFTALAGGTSAQSWKATLVSDGNLQLSANAYLENYTAGSYDEGYRELVLVSGRDLETLGTAKTTDISGGIIVRDQINMSGNIHLFGYVIAAGMSPSPKSADPAGLFSQNFIGGNMQITYDGSAGFDLPACKVKILSWRESPGGSAFDSGSGIWQ